MRVTVTVASYSSIFLARANRRNVDLHYWITTINIDFQPAGFHDVTCKKQGSCLKEKGIAAGILTRNEVRANGLWTEFRLHNLSFIFHISTLKRDQRGYQFFMDIFEYIFEKANGSAVDDIQHVETGRYHCNLSVGMIFGNTRNI